MLYKIINDDLKAWALIHIWGLANSLSFIFQVHWEDTNSKVEYGIQILKLKKFQNKLMRVDYKEDTTKKTVMKILLYQHEAQFKKLWWRSYYIEHDVEIKIVKTNKEGHFEIN